MPSRVTSKDPRKSASSRPSPTRSKPTKRNAGPSARCQEGNDRFDLPRGEFADRDGSEPVTDTGPGIPLDQQDRIFERFHQVDSTLTKAKGGTGLGLAIAKQIVE